QRPDPPRARAHPPREDHAKPSHHERHRARRRDAPARAWAGPDGGLSVATNPPDHHHAGRQSGRCPWSAVRAGSERAPRPDDRGGQSAGRHDANRRGCAQSRASRRLHLMIVTSEATMLPFLKKSYRYDPVKDFTPIALLATSWTVFAVNPKVPANTLAELIAYSKANPGRVLYGSGGVRGALHIAVEMLRLKTGADFVHVPYRGGG